MRFHNRNGVQVPYTPAEEAQRDADEAQAAIDAQADAARAAERVVALAETPASVNSIPALRDKVNEILRVLRGEI